MRIPPPETPQFPGNSLFQLIQNKKTIVYDISLGEKACFLGGQQLSFPGGPCTALSTSNVHRFELIVHLFTCSCPRWFRLAAVYRISEKR